MFPKNVPKKVTQKWAPKLTSAPSRSTTACTNLASFSSSSPTSGRGRQPSSTILAQCSPGQSWWQVFFTFPTCCFEQSCLQGRRSKTPVRSRVTAIIEGSLGGGGSKSVGGGFSNNRQHQQSQSSAGSSPRPQNVAAPGSLRSFGSPVQLPQSNPASPRPHSCLGSPKPSSFTGSPKPSSCVSSPRQAHSCLSSPRLAASGSSASPRARNFQHQFDMFSGGQQVDQFA